MERHKRAGLPSQSWWAWLRRFRWRLLALFVGVLSPLALFGMLADEVMDREPFLFDEPLLRFARGTATPLLDTLFLWITRLGYEGVIAADIVGAAWLLWQRRKGDLFCWVVSLVGAGLLNQTAKLIFARPRPDLWLPIAPETSFSFPSGHAMTSMALFATLIVFTWHTPGRWPVAGLGGIFVLLVGYSRIYIGVHFPSDILAGWAASVAWVIGVSLVLYRRPVKPSASAEPSEGNRPAT